MPPRLSIVALVIFLSACAAGQWPLERKDEASIDNDPRLGEAVDTVCFSSGVSGFYPIADQAIVLKRSLDEAYVVRTGYCPKLDAVEGLKITDPSGCLKRGDRLDIYDTPFPRAGEPSDRPDRCLVLAIHRWG